MGFSRDPLHTTKMMGIIPKTKNESVKFDKMNEINSAISYSTRKLGQWIILNYTRFKSYIDHSNCFLLLIVYIFKKLRRK